MDAKLPTQPYKGTRDFYPQDMRLRNWFFGKIRRTLELLAYDEYGGPMVEPFSIYAAKSGGELAGEQTYHFTDKGGREVAIRPEMTPTAARLVAARINELSFPVKWFSIPNLYRYERPQRGRLREHWQVNVDIFGCETQEADIEIIQCAAMLMLAYGADETMFRVHVCNRRYFQDAVASTCRCGSEGAAAISKIVDRRAKVARSVFEEELAKAGLSAEEAARLEKFFGMGVDEAVAALPESAGARELAELFGGLRAAGLDRFCEFDFSVVRGLDYYTGTVFEVFDLDPANNRAMFGGGRYDDLVGMFVGNRAVPGVGFGFGDVTLENFLATHGLVPAGLGGERKAMVLRLAGTPYAECARVAAELRAAGIPCSVFLGDKKAGKQIEHALKEGFTHVVFLGDDEACRGVAKVKDLASRVEAEAPLGRLAEAFA